MSFADCILQNEALTPLQRERLLDEYNDLYERYQGTMGDSLAASAAASKFMSIKEAQLQKARENQIRDILAWKELNGKIQVGAAKARAFREKAGAGKFLFGKSGVATATRSFLEDVYVRHSALERRATLAMADTIEKFRSKHAGITQNVEGFKGVVRAALGEKTGDAEINGHGQAIRETFDMLHKMYEQAGGILGKLENYFPQSHDPKKVGRASFEQWRDYITPLLDRERMIDPDTGLPFSDKKLNEALRASYDGIRTNGLDELAIRASEGKQTFGKGSVAKRHGSSRFLHFKSPGAFFDYNNNYGFGDAGLFDAMMGHIHVMTRDISLMQEMGPNPAGQIERLKLNIEADGAAPQATRTVQGMYDVLAGRTSYTGELPTWYKAIRATQDWLRASYLVGAPISALSDGFYTGYTAKLNGLPTTKVLGRYFSLLNPVSNIDRRVARRLSFVSGASAGKGFQNARFQDDLGSRGLTGWLSSFVNRASGLQAMTDAVRDAPVLETMGFLSELRAQKTTWENLPPAMREAFERWGMNRQDYINIKKSTPHIDPETGADFLRPEDVATSGFMETATKYEIWLTDMGLASSNEPRLLTRAIATGAVLGDAREGTALRATASSLMMFKSFGFTVMMNHLIPALRHTATERGFSRLSRIAPYLVGSMFMGMISLQARQIVQGKTAREVDEKLAAASLMQGGGFGIFGDFIFSDYSRFGQDLTKTAAGPMMGFASDATRVFKGNFDRMLDEDSDSKFWADFYQFAERNTPAIKLWYIRLLSERLLLDQVERMIDPKFDKRMARQEKRMREDYGQDFWWKPGEAVPEPLN